MLTGWTRETFPWPSPSGARSPSLHMRRRRRGWLLIVQGQEFREVLILATHPTGLLQGTPMFHQIVADRSRVRVQPPSMDVERKAVEVLPSVLVKGHARAGPGKVMKELHGRYVHLQRLFTGPVFCASYRVSNSMNRSNSALMRLAASCEKSWVNRWVTTCQLEMGRCRTCT